MLGGWCNKESSPYRGDSLVYVWIIEVLQFITSSFLWKIKIYALQNLQTLIIQILS